MDLFAHLNVYVVKRDKLKQLIASIGISPQALITAIAFVGATAIAIATCYLKPKQDQEMSREIGVDVNDRNGIYPPSESQCSTCASEEGGDQHEEEIEANSEQEVQNKANGEVDVKHETIIFEPEFMNETIIEEDEENEAVAEEGEKIEAINETNNVSLEEEAAEVQEFLADIESEFMDVGAEDVSMTPIETPKAETSQASYWI